MTRQNLNLTISVCLLVPEVFLLQYTLSNNGSNKQFRCNCEFSVFVFKTASSRPPCLLFTDFRLPTMQRFEPGGTPHLVTTMWDLRELYPKLREDFPELPEQLKPDQYTVIKKLLLDQNVVLQARTGSGKSLIYSVLPLLQDKVKCSISEIFFSSNYI